MPTYPMRCKICNHEMEVFLRDVYDNRHGYDGYFSLYKCCDCGFIQTEPAPSPGLIQEIYTRYYPRDTLDIDKIVNKVLKLPSKLKIYKRGMATYCHFLCEPGKRVLDIGCGHCDSIRYLSLMGCDAYGVEPDTNIKPIVERLGLKVKIGLLDVNDYRKGFFDIITMSQVLEHVHDPVGYLKKLRRILADDGKIIMSFPNADSLLARWTGRKWINYHVPYHLNHFTRRSVEILAHKAGYRVEKIKYVTPNRWLGYQIYDLLFQAKRGEPSPFWSRTKNYTPLEKIVTFFIGAAERFDLLFLFARGLDLIKRGEALVVTLRCL